MYRQEPLIIELKGDPKLIDAEALREQKGMLQMDLGLSSDEPAAG
jgi:hypothetical protein